MRFNDMIATVLAGSAERPEAREAQWRQLVDLLAQRQAGAPDAARDEAFAFLRDQRSLIAPRVRAAAVASLTGLTIDPHLVQFFAEDRAEIAAPLLRSVRLETRDWLQILPRLGPTARALLRHRRDLAGEVRRALETFGPSDLVLGRELTTSSQSHPVEAEPAKVPRGEGGSPILELVERIEAYQRQRREPTEVEPNERVEALAPAAAFRWETSAEGVISWVDGAPRGPLVGLSIATAAGAAQSGVEEEVSQAFGRRTPFRDARLHVATEDGAGGEWRASGVPYFDPARGAFRGYRGAARRAGGTVAVPSAFGPALPPDSLRQLIHELRTPLNAIMGFAELIEGQFMGPAADRYRTRAADIMDQASRLLNTVDDLDTAAQIESQRLAETAGRSDVAVLLARLRPSYDNAARQRGAYFELAIANDLPEAAVAPAVTERLLARLLAATIGLAREGEGITAGLESAPHGQSDTIVFSIDRPRAVAGLDAQALLDPAFTPAGDWPAAPALGLGFALRLIGNLADAAGGELLIGTDRIQLLLPVAPAAESGA